MRNRIRDIRRARGLTLSQVAARCQPPTTAQTVGRLETGMRTLSLEWMNRIAAALEVEPRILLSDVDSSVPQVIARLSERGIETLATPFDAVIDQGVDALVLEIGESCGEYRAGDRLWLRRIAPGEEARHVNRDALVPLPGAEFAFGRLFIRDGSRIGLLPPQSGQSQIVIDDPPWIAVAHMLVRMV
ncbi:helix-turn-helix domain-containing protein [Novosphingobium aquimarinum]|uniref:helix-turn-helix domain-containing protein n=1 Tax=Novosphingobium aquimarinum TaxID=2682494 RepID=UPI0012EBABC8|nr:helix-turn-helix transcriptional regulator [Novosphingobium aquimarinum]